MNFRCKSVFVLGKHLLSIAALILATLGTLRCAQIGSKVGGPLRDINIWGHWDSGIYEGIAEHGYEIHRCESSSNGWCGNTAWFAGYPFAASILTKTFDISVKRSLANVSRFFFVIQVVAFYLLIQRRFVSDGFVGKTLVGLLASIFPGCVYYLAIFPISMCMAFSLLALLLYEKLQGGAKRLTMVHHNGKLMLLLWASEVLACMTYTIGWVLPLAFAVGEILRAFAEKTFLAKRFLLLHVRARFQVLVKTH